MPLLAIAKLLRNIVLLDLQVYQAYQDQRVIEEIQVCQDLQVHIIKFQIDLRIYLINKITSGIDGREGKPGIRGPKGEVGRNSHDIL